jgi:hypothetical protein
VIKHLGVVVVRILCRVTEGEDISFQDHVNGVLISGVDVLALSISVGERRRAQAPVGPSNRVRCHANGVLSVGVVILALSISVGERSEL